MFKTTKPIFIYLYPSNPKLQAKARCASPLPEAKKGGKVNVSCSEQFIRTTKTVDVCVPSSETKKMEQDKPDVSCSERSKTLIKNMYVRPFVWYQKEEE